LSIFEVKHQDHAIDRFQQAWVANRLSHAYIFAGPDGIGKGLTAREIAQILLCQNPVRTDHAPTPESQPWLDSCGGCASCKLVRVDNHPDLHVVYKELIKNMPGKDKHLATELGIDVIRQEVIETVSRKPSVGKNKVFIILEAHLMSRSAQNALLKTLEEPPPNTYLILISERVGAMLPTIRSRAQTLLFNLLPEAFLMEKLKQAGANEGQSHFFAQFSPGKLGRALELYELGVYDLNERLGKDLAVVDLAGADDFAQWILEQAKALAEKMTQREQAGSLKARKSESELNRIAVKLIFALTGGFFRDALRYTLGFDSRTLLNRDRPSSVKALAESFPVEGLTRRIRDLSEAEKMIDANVNVTLVVTDVLNKIYSG
jgi:DNA polymerase-3 subunit delta'